MRISWPDLKLYSKNKVLEHHKTNHANYFKLIGSRTELLDFELNDANVMLYPLVFWTTGLLYITKNAKCCLPSF